MNKDNKTMVDLSDEELLEMAGGFNVTSGETIPISGIAVILYGVLPTNPEIFLPKYGIKPFPGGIQPLYGIKPMYGIKAVFD